MPYTILFRAGTDNDKEQEVPPVEEKTAALESGAPQALPESVSDSESAPD